MKDRLGHCIPRPTAKITLRIDIQEDWDALTNDDIASMVNSMADRAAAVLAADTGHIQF